MKNSLVVFILFLAQLTNAQHIIHEIEYDEYTQETFISIQDQQNKGAYDQKAGTSHLFSDFLHWRIEINSIDKKGDDRIIALVFLSPNDDTYGGLHDADIIFKFTDGSTVKTKVAGYNYEEDSITILGEDYPVYTLTCVLMLSPDAYIDNEIDKSGILLKALSTKKVDGVRMYFGEGYVNFEVRDKTIFKRLLARLNTLTP